MARRKGRSSYLLASAWGCFFHLGFHCPKGFMAHLWGHMDRWGQWGGGGEKIHVWAHDAGTAPREGSGFIGLGLGKPKLP